MAYTIKGSRFGMRRIPGEMAYDCFHLTLTPHPFATRRNPYGNALRPLNFTAFPYWADEHFQDDDFTFDLQFALDLQFQHTHYLGPLRAQPNPHIHLVRSPASRCGFER